MWGYKVDDDIKKRRHTTKDSGKTMDWCYKWTCVASPKLVIEARCLPHLAFSRRLRLLPHFRWGWLCLPPSRLGHWASSWLSAWRRFLTVASLRDFFLGLILNHGVFQQHIGCPVKESQLIIKFYRTVKIEKYPLKVTRISVFIVIFVASLPRLHHLFVCDMKGWRGGLML